MNDNKTQFINGISIQSVITLTLGVLEIAVFAVMSRLLTKENFGYFAALTGIMTICTSITEAGLASAIIQKKDASSSFVSTAFTLSWILGITGSCLVFSFAPLLANLIADNHLTWPLRIMSINIFLACIASVGQSVLIKNLKFKKIGSYQVLAYSFSSALGILLAFLGFGLYAIVSVSVCNLVLLNVILYSQSVKLPKFGVNKNEIRGIMSFGGWLTMSVIFNNITQQMDRLFLSKWISVSVLGSYNRPAGFVATITGKINGIFDTVLFPMLSKIQDEPTRVQSVFVRAIKLLNSFAGVLFAIFFFNAYLIIITFFGTKWIELVPVLQIISVFVIFNVDNRLVDCFFRSLNWVKLGFWLRVISAIVTFFALFCGSHYGIYGVATSLVLANIFTVCIKITALSYKVKVSIIQVIKSFIIAEKPLVPLCIIGIPFLLWGQTSILIHILFAAAMGCLILCEFLFFPRIVGTEYTNTIFPAVEKIKNKIIR